MIFRSTIRFRRVSCPKPPSRLVVVPGSEVIEANAAVVSLAAVEENVRRGAASFDRHSKRVIVVGIRDRPSRVCEEAHVAVTVIRVFTCRLHRSDPALDG